MTWNSEKSQLDS